MGLAKDYDHFAAEYVDDPYAFWRQLREEEPVARSEKYGGFHVISRYEDIVEAAQDTERFSSTDGAGIPPLPMVGMIPIDTDPPDHREYRAIINPALTVNAARKHEDRIRALAVELVEPLVGRDEFEVSSAVATVMAPKATLGFVGFPEEDHELMIKATDDVTRLRGTETPRVAEAGMEMFQTATKLVMTRRAQDQESADADDLLRLLIEGDFQGRKLADQEIVMNLMVLLFGAVDTTASAINGALYYLATHPEDQRQLRDGGEIPNLALEELIRWSSPLQGLGRTVTQDTEIGGCPMHKGDRVLLHWASGNRDASQFSDPENVDLERKPNKHLGFGMGPHRCVGVHFGKLMLRVTLEEFLARIPQFELADPSQLKWLGGEARGLRNLPLKLS